MGEKDQSKFSIAKDILVQMGTYFQVQDDVLDCYGDPAVIGKVRIFYSVSETVSFILSKYISSVLKVGTDIEDTKCSWLVVQALQRASPEQKQIILVSFWRA